MLKNLVYTLALPMAFMASVLAHAGPTEEALPASTSATPVNTQPALMYHDAWHTQQLSAAQRLRRTESNHESLHGSKGLPSEVWIKIIESLDTLSRTRFAKACKGTRQLELGARVHTVDLSYTSPQIPAGTMDQQALNELLVTIPKRVQLRLNLKRCYLPPCFSDRLQVVQAHNPIVALHLEGSTLGLPDRQQHEFPALARSLPAFTHLRVLDLTFGFFEPNHVVAVLQSAPVSLVHLILDKNRLNRGNAHNAVIQAFPRLKNLRTLSLNKSRWPHQHLQGLLTTLQTLPHFRSLEFQENGLTEDTLAALDVGDIQVRI